MAVKTRQIKDLMDGVAALLTREDLNSVSNLNGALERAFRTFSQKANIPEAEASSVMTLWDGVYRYSAMTPLFGSTIRDARPIGQDRMATDMATRLGGEDFDRTKNDAVDGYKVSFETENGQNILLVKTRFSWPKILLDPMNATTGWTAGGNAGSLAKDKTIYYQTPASLRLNMTAAGTGYIEKTLTTAIDMTDYLNSAKVFLELYLSSTGKITSIELRLGSDSSNYYSMTATQGNLGAWTAGEFMDTPFDMTATTTTGSPDITKIKYVRVTFTASAALSAIRVGNLFASLPSQHKFLFTTTGIFKATDNSINNFITDENDTILLNDAAYNIYEHECALTIGLQEGGTLADGITATINATLNGARARTGAVISLGLYDKFRADNPSEDIRQGGTWY